MPQGTHLLSCELFHCRDAGSQNHKVFTMSPNVAWLIHYYLELFCQVGWSADT